VITAIVSLDVAAMAWQEEQYEAQIVQLVDSLGDHIDPLRQFACFDNGLDHGEWR
jgi:hypothetical protein